MSVSGMLKIGIDLQFLHIGLGRPYPVQGAIGGIGRVQLAQMQAFEDRKRQFEFLLIGDKKYSKAILEDSFSNLQIKETLLLSRSLYRSCPVKSVTKPFIRFSQNREYKSFRDQVQEKHPDVIHTHGETWHLSKEELSYKTILTIHDHLFPASEVIYRRSLDALNEEEKEYLNELRTADSLITVSDAIREQMIEDYHFDSSRVITIPNAVDFKEFSSTPRFLNERKIIKEKFSINKPYFIYAGSWYAKKRVPFIIDVFEQYRKKYNKNVGLVLAGNVERFAKKQTQLIRERIRSSPYASDIRELGYLLDEDLAILNRNAEAFLHLTFYEGFGLGVCEAMACGVPLVAAKGVGALQKTEIANELLDPSDVETIVERMNKIITDTAYRELLLEKQNKVIEQLSWKKSAEQLLALYERMMSE